MLDFGAKPCFTVPFYTQHASMTSPNPEIIPIGWDGPALELLAVKLLDEKILADDDLRRATFVVPTAESGRSLKEYMAQRAGRPLLMPRMTVPGHIIELPDVPNAATPMDTEAAWLQVLLEVADEVKRDENGEWFHLFPKAPVGNVMLWAANMARQLQQLRDQMEQECLTARYGDLIQDYYPDFVARRNDAWKRFLGRMQERWAAVRRIFAAVDARLKAQGLATAEEITAMAVESPQARRQGSLVVLACVPELSPLNELYLRHCMARGQHRVLVLVNAPAGELCHFDAFGRPLVKDADGARHARWLTNAIPLHVDGDGQPTTHEGLRHIHLVPDADAMGAKAVELAGGKDSAGVVVGACDSAMAPAIHAAFLRRKENPWVLNIPSGLSLAASAEGQLPELLADALEIPYRYPDFNAADLTAAIKEPNMLAPLVQLLRNAAMQQAYAAGQNGPKADLSAFNKCLDDVMAEHYPAHPDYLLKQLAAACGEGGAQHAHHLYAQDACRLLQQCWQGAPQAAEALLELADRLRLSRAPFGGSLLADALSRVAAYFTGRGRKCTPQVRLCLLRRELEDAVAKQRPLLPKERTNGDLAGWRELPFCRGEHLIVCGMHNDCVPERPRTDVFLPDELRCSVGLLSSESRTARDSYLLTALLHSRPGNVHFILARTRADGTPPAPSTLLLRCGDDKGELAARAAYLFHESKDVFEKPPYRHWSLLRSAAPPEGEMGNVSQIIRRDNVPVVNRYAARETFSPSFLRGFLACPLRFWLNHLLDLNPGNAYPDDLSELQPNAFGLAMHEVLNRFVAKYKDAACLPQGDEQTATDTMKHDIFSITDDVFKQYGGSSRIIMRVQKEQLQAAMAAFAALHYRDLTEGGWRNMARECPLRHPFTLDDGTKVLLDARIDRIDCRERDGRTEWRIIDYKSNDKQPNDNHYAPMGDSENDRKFRGLMPELAFEYAFRIAEDQGAITLYRWKDLQLPIYAEALKTFCAERGLPYSLPELGYFNIPRGTADVAYNILAAPGPGQEPMSETAMEQAMQCARRVISLIRRGDCLYSAEQLGLPSPEYARFGALAPDTDPRSLCGLNNEPNN